MRAVCAVFGDVNQRTNQVTAASAPALKAMVDTVAAFLASLVSAKPFGEQSVDVRQFSGFNASLFFDIATRPKTEPTASPTTPAPSTTIPMVRWAFPPCDDGS